MSCLNLGNLTLSMACPSLRGLSLSMPCPSLRGFRTLGLPCHRLP